MLNIELTLNIKANILEEDTPYLIDGIMNRIGNGSEIEKVELVTYEVEEE